MTLRRLLPLALPALLAACAGAPTRIHSLDAVAPSVAPPAAAAGPAFRVDAVHVPATFDRPELVRRTDAYTVTLSDTDRWAAPLNELVRRALTQDLLRRLPPSQVIFPDAPKPPSAEGLVVDILSLVPTPEGVDMEASWTWVRPRIEAARPGVEAVSARTSVRLRTASAGPGPSAIAPELSALIGQLADRIAAERR